MLIKSNAVDIIVIDSVAALVPRHEVEGEIGDSHVGLQARLMSQALRILNPAISRTKTCMIFINQIRQKIGVMFGNPETTSGGLALKFYSSVRLDVRKLTGIKDGEETIGSRVKVRVVKNKVAPPFRQAEFDLMHDRGISREGDLIDLAIEDKLIEKSRGLDQLRQRAARPGPRERQAVPARQPGPGRRDSPQGAGEARPGRPGRRQRRGRERTAGSRRRPAAAGRRRWRI